MIEAIAPIMKSMVGLMFGAGILSLLFVIARPATTATTKIQSQSAEAVESKFLEQWLGEWEGAGTSDGRAVRDRMMFQWALDRRFLRFIYQALAGYMRKGKPIHLAQRINNDKRG
jgi:cytochrome c oxidase assembly factor CtaG